MDGVQDGLSPDPDPDALFHTVALWHAQLRSVPSHGDGARRFQCSKCESFLPARATLPLGGSDALDITEGVAVTNRRRG